MEQFDSNLSSVIDSTLGLKCRLYGYQYSEIIRSLMSDYFCGGSYIEDVTTHLMYHLSLHPTLRTCSADTILRAIKELTQDNSCHSETKAHGWRTWLVGRWIHLQMHSYQRLWLINKRHRSSLATSLTQVRWEQIRAGNSKRYLWRLLPQVVPIVI